MIRFFLFPLSLLPTLLFSQESDSLPNRDSLKFAVRIERNLSFFIGYGYNFARSHILETGIGINSFGVIGHHPHSSGIALSTEWRLTPWQDQLLGHKVSAWFGGGVAAMEFGLNLIYYYGKSGTATVFRPETGMAIGPVNVVYGYLIPFRSGNLLGLSRHQVNVLIPLKLKLLKEIHR